MQVKGPFINDYSALANYTNLETIILNQSKFTNGCFQYINELPNLKELGLVESENLYTIENLDNDNIKSLDISMCYSLENTERLAKLTNLEELKSNCNFHLDILPDIKDLN